MNLSARFERSPKSNALWRSALLVPLFATCALFAPHSDAQQETTTKRRVMTRAAAPYPALARHMALAGVVKVDALIAPDGTVKSLDVKGGHPVLAQAAANAIRQWKWEPAAHESHELVEIRFSPPE